MMAHRNLKSQYLKQNSLFISFNLVFLNYFLPSISVYTQLYKADPHLLNFSIDFIATERKAQVLKYEYIQDIWCPASYYLSPTLISAVAVVDGSVWANFLEPAHRFPEGTTCLSASVFFVAPFLAKTQHSPKLGEKLYSLRKTSTNGRWTPAGKWSNLSPLQFWTILEVSYMLLRSPGPNYIFIAYRCATGNATIPVSCFLHPHVKSLSQILPLGKPEIKTVGSETEAFRE